MLLYGVYSIEAIDELIKQTKVKHLEGELTPPQKAALQVLATYIDLIT